MNDAERTALITGADTITVELLEQMRRLRERRRASGSDVSRVDQLLAELEDLAHSVHDIAILDAVRRTLARHAPGPYARGDLATITGVTPADADRALQQLLTAGLARPITTDQ